MALALTGCGGLDCRINSLFGEPKASLVECYGPPYSVTRSSFQDDLEVWEYVEPSPIEYAVVIDGVVNTINRRTR